MCYLLHSPERTEIAHRLLDREPSLIETVYTGTIYHGENALHMAIANSDLPEARFLFRRCPRLLYGHAGVLAGAHPELMQQKLHPVTFPRVRRRLLFKGRLRPGRQRVLRRAPSELW